MHFFVKALDNVFLNYISTLKYYYRYQIYKYFFTNFNFSFLQEWEYQYKKNWRRDNYTKLRETILTMTNYNLHKSNWLIKRELKYMSTVQNCNIGVARTHANTQNGDLYSISQPLKTVNYCFKALHPRCLPRSWLRLYKNR